MRVPDNADKVQITWFEVGRDVLVQQGDPLPAALARNGLDRHWRPVDNSSSRPPPEVGWRLLHRSGDDGFHNVVLGTPESDGWTLVHATRPPDGEWSLTCDGEQHPELPSRAARCSTITLAWTAERFSWVSGDPPTLAATLHNHGSGAFPACDEDFVAGVAHLLTAAGESLPYEAYFAYGSGTFPAVAEPGESVAVPLHLATTDAASLPPGEYLAVARLICLDVITEPVPITIHAR